MINKGYLTAKTDKVSDEVYTPKYAVEPLLKYIKPNFVIWCPFDEEWSAYVQIFKEQGYKVIYSHIDAGENFFYYEPQEHYDVIISNPPFSIKDDILKRLSELNRPYAVLLPLNTLQGQKRFKYMNDIQLLSFDKRICFYTDKACENISKGVAFASGYFCKNFLPKDLILEEIEIRDEKLNK